MVVIWWPWWPPDDNPGGHAIIGRLDKLAATILFFFKRSHLLLAILTNN